MKKLLLLISLFTFTLHGTDALLFAIKKSDPKLVKCEINKLILKGQKPSIKDKHMYIDFAEEVIIRRHNAIQLPSYIIQQPHYYYYGAQPISCYYTSQPVYTNAYTTDEDPEISFNCRVRCILGTLGTIASFFYLQNSITNYKRAYSKTTANLVFASGVISFIALCSAIIEINLKRKYHQEQLYENAVEIKHILINMETI